MDPLQKSKRNWKERDLAHFANVKIYLRKWVSEAFAGVLGGDVLLYVWDLVSSRHTSNGNFKDISKINAYFRQIFVNRWSSSIFAKITLALLFLLKQWALQASNHRQLSRVLFNEPGKVRLYCPICCPAIHNL